MTAMETTYSGIKKTKKTIWLAVVLTLMLVSLGLLLAPAPAQAKTFTVDITGDAPDKAPGDGKCDTTSTIVILCSFRAAIQEANKLPGVDAIHFGIPDSGVQTIKPNSQLPYITTSVTINGYTQPGASPNTSRVQGATNAKPLIELDGTDAGPSTDGLVIYQTGGVVVKGLVINRFGDKGIWLGGPGPNRVEGNFIGTDPSGTEDRGNDTVGVNVNGGSNHTVGGTTPAAPNLISGNDGSGINIENGTDLKVQGNLIGTDKSATADLGNSSDGVAIMSSANASNITVGGSAPARNTIAFNGGDGVVVGLVGLGSSVNNRILFNSIFSNGGIGMDLIGGSEDSAGNTANDRNDPDAGPNKLQNKPIIASATTSGGKTTIEGTLNSLPKRGFVIQFFSNPAGEEGKRFVGEEYVATDAGGNASFDFVVPKLTVPVGQTVTATATGREGTSELSEARSVT